MNSKTTFGETMFYRGFAEAPGFELRSPKDGDHFEVSKPMLFWAASAGAKCYEIDVDGVKAGAAPAGGRPGL